MPNSIAPVPFNLPYDCDAYGNTLIFTAAGTGSIWWADDAVVGDNPTCEYIFTGRCYDSNIAIYFYRARYFSSQIGRFLSRDWKPSAGEKDPALLFYPYARSNPLVVVDPSGQIVNLLVGAGLGIGIEVASQMLLEGKSLNELDYRYIAAAALVGAFVPGASLGRSFKGVRLAAKCNVRLAQKLRAATSYIMRNEIFRRQAWNEFRLANASLSKASKKAMELAEKNAYRAVAEYVRSQIALIAAKAGADALFHQAKCDKSPEQEVRSEHTFCLGPKALGLIEFEQASFEEEAGTSLPLVNWFDANCWKVWFSPDGRPVQKALVNEDTGEIIGNEIAVE